MLAREQFERIRTQNAQKEILGAGVKKEQFIDALGRTVNDIECEEWAMRLASHLIEQGRIAFTHNCMQCRICPQQRIITPATINGLFVHLSYR